MVLKISKGEVEELVKKLLISQGMDLSNAKFKHTPEGVEITFVTVQEGK
jgi:hypothetical protein